MLASRSVAMELTPESMDLLAHAPEDWVQLPATILRRQIRRAFSSLESLGFIEQRTLNTAPSITYQWRLTPKGRERLAERHAGVEPPLRGPTAEPGDTMLFRAYLDESLAHVRRSREALAVFIIGIRAAGASRRELIEAVGTRVRACIRGTDSFAPLGPGFAICHAALSQPEQTKRLAERILARIDEPCAIAGRLVSAQACIGIAFAPRDGDEPDVLLGRAEAALNVAWAAGPGNIRHYGTSSGS